LTGPGAASDSAAAGTRPLVVVVYMTPEATTEELAAVRELLEAEPTIARVEFLDRAQAFERIQRLFARQPELIRDVTVERTPTLYRCTFADPKPDLERISRLGGGLPGVYKATIEPPPRAGPQSRFGWVNRFVERHVREGGLD
jgi:cell division protein FtsX